MNPKVKVGDEIKIIKMEGEPNYTGRQGIIEYIDGAGQLHGNWGRFSSNTWKRYNWIKWWKK